MPLRVISVSKIICDLRWQELGISELPPREQHSANFMVVLKANSEKSSIKLQIVGIESPQELIFANNTKVRIGSGMLMYDDINLVDSKVLPLNSLDKEF